MWKDFKQGFMNALTLKDIRWLIYNHISYPLQAARRRHRMLKCTRNHKDEPYEHFNGWALGTGHYPVRCTKCGTLKYINSKGEWYRG